LSYVARAALENVLQDNSVRARGPLRRPTPLPAEVAEKLHWPDVDIPPTFWPNTVWDGRDGFRNPTSGEKLYRLEVSETELIACWPVADRIAMPAPFHVDWPPISQVIDAMTRCLGLSREAALKRLIGDCEDKKLKASERHGSCGRYSFENWKQADPNAVHDPHQFSTQGGGPIVLWADDVIALEPRLMPPYSAWPRASAQVGPVFNALRALSVNAPAKARTRTATLAEKVSEELRQMFPKGRPAMSVKELTKQVKQRLGRATLGQRTVEAAIPLAWANDRTA
jgi:hypothetical protein